jgi:hypothetical protein
LPKSKKQVTKEVGFCIFKVLGNIGLAYLIYKGFLSIREDMMESYNGWLDLYSTWLTEGVGWKLGTSAGFLLLAVFGFIAKMAGIKEQIQRLRNWFKSLSE